MACHKANRSELLLQASTDTNDDTNDDLLLKCWSHQECWDCLSQGPCSWCPVSSTCVPNRYRIQIFAPIYEPDICPLWYERWELRSSSLGLGCHVSTITLFTCIISVLSTFVVIGLVSLGIKLVRKVVAKFKARSKNWWKVWRYYQAGWWREWRLRLVDIKDTEAPEQRPLLAQADESV